MATQVLMPKLGLTMTEGTIEEWKIGEGDPVKAGDILFSVATDKLTNDIEAETDGVLLKILLGEGETAKCKEVIAWIGAEGEEVPDVEQKSNEESEDAAEESGKTAPASAANKSAVPSARGYVPASPYAKKLAKEYGYDISKIPGTGPGGRIVAKDVMEYSASPKISPVAAKIAADLEVDVSELGIEDRRIMKADVLAASGRKDDTSVQSVQYAGDYSDNVLEIRKADPLRRSIAANMKASWDTSPAVTYNSPADVTEMIRMRSVLKDEMAERGIKLTYNHIIMKACAKALMEFPDVNASFADNELTIHRHANIGLAVAKGDGLIVPNVKACDSKSLSQIADEAENLITATREGKLGMDDMTGGTFTVTNIGVYGITSFSPIINQPELAILGVCDIVKTPVVDNEGNIIVKPMMNLSLTADHRVIDGVMAARFLKRIIEIIENPYLLIS